MAAIPRVSVSGQAHELLFIHAGPGGEVGIVVANGTETATAFFFRRYDSEWRAVPVQHLGQPPYQLPVALRNYVSRERGYKVLYQLTDELQQEVLAAAVVLIDGHLVAA